MSCLWHPVEFNLEQGFEKMVLQLNQNAPTEAFAKAYLKDAKEFLDNVEIYRKLELTNA